MSFTMKDLLAAVGGNAALVFAAWIFMTYLQARYTAAFNLYRTLIGSYRDGLEGTRKDSVAQQILLYRKRCEQMRRATSLGMVSAIFLLLALLCGGASVLFPGAVALNYVGAACILLGLSSVIGAAVYVLRENASIRRALDAELATVPELATRKASVSALRAADSDDGRSARSA
jgi:hypothetical protein